MGLFTEIVASQMAELIRELNRSLQSCQELRREMLEAKIAVENLVHLDALLWLPPYVSFWIEGNSPLLQFNARKGKFEKVRNTNL